MMKVFRRSCTCGALLSIAMFAAVASAQDAEPAGPIMRQVQHMNLAVSGTGQFTKTTTGNNYLPQLVTQVPSNTLGALVTIQYIHSPLIGFEFNYGYARYTENFTAAPTTGTPNGTTSFVLGVQTKAAEYTIGYTAHARNTYFGLRPFAGAGAGSIAFTPTKGGGQGFLEQARAVYYYGVGVEAPLYGHFSARAQFRQLFFLAPDYQTNYIRTLQRTTTSEPTFGFFVHF